MARLPKICRHLHLPVQSGSTRVLEAMRRRYTRDSYLDLIAQIRESLPDVALSTDMIVGFPGETDADFDDTLTLTASVRYHSMFSFKYSPRPNTLADKRLADDVPEEEKTRRIVALQALQREIQSALNERWSGRRSTCWSTRPAGAARSSCPDGRAPTWWSICRDRRSGSAGRAGPDRARGTAQRLGTDDASTCKSR